MIPAVESILQNAMPHVAPAIALAAYHRGKRIAHGAWGWLLPEDEQHPVQETTLFDLASLTKLFTTSAFLVLASHEGRALQTPLVALLPEFGAEAPRSIDGGQDPHSKAHLPTPEEYQNQQVDPAQVTLWHLLTHSSGLPPWRDVYNASPAPAPPDEPQAVSAAERWRRGLQRLLHYPFVQPVGAGVRYSDVGLMLLGEVVARLHGGTLEEAIQTQVLIPLGLENVLFNPVREKQRSRTDIAPTENDPTWRKRRVWGEVHDENACGMGGVAGHAGLFGTADEVARLGLAWLQRSGLAISADLWQAAIEEQIATDGERRGLGWMLPSYENSSAGDVMSRSAYGHTGFTGTSLWVDPTRELVVALLTNRVYWGRERTGIHGLRRAVHDALVEAVS